MQPQYQEHVAQGSTSFFNLIKKKKQYVVLRGVRGE